mmetsp:Transcript_3280/g.4966  ORF Transcript_3280/g.4966 Transcript_3280/m.4966 type:complete len:341 (-) Transcript_3280:120-1142(-)|eukprot:CAMPEP_0167749392 /NCGR_PEP_ID=MMETSP0110_2-20121227/5381_1 /TAXON_ID=629695 /ORGANISM="Gymnochlora sp., Strain CCMP2014" /LENGTH=340 /DNA_ID=CAMNT_0007634539 /DNA_START=107 /DNA_END=1129 /DNA_ORIENTATION=+
MESAKIKSSTRKSEDIQKENVADVNNNVEDVKNVRGMVTTTSSSSLELAKTYLNMYTVNSLKLVLDVKMNIVPQEKGYYLSYSPEIAGLIYQFDAICIVKRRNKPLLSTIKETHNTIIKIIETVNSILSSYQPIKDLSEKRKPKKLNDEKNPATFATIFSSFYHHKKEIDNMVTTSRVIVESLIGAFKLDRKPFTVNLTKLSAELETVCVKAAFFRMDLLKKAIEPISKKHFENSAQEWKEMHVQIPHDAIKSELIGAAEQFKEAMNKSEVQAVFGDSDDFLKDTIIPFIAKFNELTVPKGPSEKAIKNQMIVEMLSNFEEILNSYMKVFTSINNASALT